MMQHDHPDREPLDHAAAREAHHSLGGYFAQVWRSVLAWTELKDDEILFLEAAEDFDILRPDEKNGDISAPRPTAEAV